MDFVGDDPAHGADSGIVSEEFKKRGQCLSVLMVHRFLGGRSHSPSASIIVSICDHVLPHYTMNPITFQMAWIRRLRHLKTQFSRLCYFGLAV